MDLLPQMLRSHQGKWVLLQNGGLTALFDTARDAHLAGSKLYPDGYFSVQQVTNRPVDLGWFSHAVP